MIAAVSNTFQLAESRVLRTKCIRCRQTILFTAHLALNTYYYDELGSWEDDTFLQPHKCQEVAA